MKKQTLLIVALIFVAGICLSNFIQQFSQPTYAQYKPQDQIGKYQFQFFMDGTGRKPHWYMCDTTTGEVFAGKQKRNKFTWYSWGKLHNHITKKAQ